MWIHPIPEDTTSDNHCQGVLRAQEFGFMNGSRKQLKAQRIQTHHQKSNLPRGNGGVHGLSHLFSCQHLAAETQCQCHAWATERRGYTIPIENNQFLKNRKLIHFVKSNWSPLEAVPSTVGYRCVRGYRNLHLEPHFRGQGDVPHVMLNIYTGGLPRYDM